MEKLEDYLVRSLERSLSKPYNRPLQLISLMPKPASPHTKYRMGRYVWGAFVFFAGLVLFGFLAGTLYLAFLMAHTFTLHQIQRHWRAMLHVAFVTTKGPLFILCLIPFVAAMLFAAVQCPAVWAWNRRADRLNRAATAPQELPANDTGVWPPPPTVSASADTLPRM